MKFTAGELCKWLNGRLEGSSDTIITHPSRIEDANEGSVSFIANSKYIEHASTTKASVLLLAESAVVGKTKVHSIIRVAEPYIAFAMVMQKFSTALANKTGIEKPSYISSSAVIGTNVYIGAFSHIGDNAIIEDGVKIFPNTTIGDRSEIKKGTILYSGVKIYADTKIGENCIVHAGTVIGSDGFGHAPLPDGSYMKIPQLGNVIIEDNVEIGANSTIDRATMGSTIIHQGVKIDNLVQIAHNVEIGEHTVIAAQTGISGSTKIGKRCLIGGQVGFVGHITIADGTRINAQSGVSKSIEEPGKAFTGSPAFNYTESLRSQVVFRHLPSLRLKIEQLEKELENLKNKSTIK